jgi:hypothetical protein
VGERDGLKALARPDSGAFLTIADRPGPIEEAAGRAQPRDTNSLGARPPSGHARFELFQFHLLLGFFGLVPDIIFLGHVDVFSGQG